MSQSPQPASDANVLTASVPVWITCFVLGAAIGGAAAAMGMVWLGYENPKARKAMDEGIAVSEPGAPSGPSTPPPMGAGMPMMMGGMGGGMGMGGMGGPRGKQNLTSWVGRLELLTRGNLAVALDEEQKAKVAEKLGALAQAEKMTADEAQSHLDELDALLRPEQKDIIESIRLPFGRPGGGGPGGSSGGGPGSSGPGAPVGMPAVPGGGMGGGGDPEENPFKQEQNGKRLKDLMERIGGASSPAPSETPAADASPAEDKPAEPPPAEDKPAEDKPAESKPE